ncbi:hypothetical protein [Blastococcus atacamensis]|uniref:hypothetical protein n=1 Tax=Blastococcus atacamensis TaxID=2070508 RepID=UPI0012FFDFBB|nr:hypothetical protein [Blastococcus atacamensis]
MIVMVEAVTALDDLDTLRAADGLDGVHVGPDYLPVDRDPPRSCHKAAAISGGST